MLGELFIEGFVNGEEHVHKGAQDFLTLSKKKKKKKK